MAYVVSLEGYTPAPRYDSTSWTQAIIKEASSRMGPWSAIDTISLTPDADPSKPATHNFTTAHATLASGWYMVTFADANGNTQDTDPTGGSGGLVTLDEVKDILDIDPTDTRKDAMFSALIPAASLAIRNYAERDFGAPTVQETRNFEYDGSGFVDIDDAADITAVEFVVPHYTNIPLSVDEWYGAPSRRDDSPVFYYIVLMSPAGISPYMGFNRNIDVLYEEGRLPSVSRTVAVTATWGWPDIPPDVKLATIWTLQDWTLRPSSEGLTSEAISGYSRSWGSRSGSGPTPSLAIPNKARDVLEQYRKQSV